MCNAYNRSADCPCGFGGDTGGWGGRRNYITAYRHQSVEEVLERPVSAGWAKDKGTTVASYVNPNAHCPVCGKLVYFYRSPYDGRVYFDELGWPWPKHGCTDNRREPLRATRGSARSSAPRPVPQWKVEGWSPVLSAKVYAGGNRGRLTGDIGDKYYELTLPFGEKMDAESPVLVRQQATHPLIFDVTFLDSDVFGNVQEQKTVAFDRRIAALGEGVLKGAARGHRSACAILGSFLLWHLDDPMAARPYLQHAAEADLIDALFDLAIIELFAAPN
jgi:hypothetical protein